MRERRSGRPAPRAVQFRERIAPSGIRVHYDVVGIGAFTLGFGDRAEDEQIAAATLRGDLEYLHVVYGTWDGQPAHPGWYTVLPSAPNVNRVPLAGAVTFTVRDALAHLDPDPETCRRHPYWLNVWRANPPQDGERRAPDLTRLRTADIVASLTRHLLDRADLDQLLTAHRRHAATRLLSFHRTNIALAREELHEWAARLAHEQDLLRIREEISITGTLAPPETPIPWRPEMDAATPAGRAFLRRTAAGPR